MPLPPILKKWINAWLKDEGSENVKYDSDLDGKIDQLRTILRSDLEYPTEDVSLAYLHAIGKTQFKATPQGPALVTLDSFADKCVSGFTEAGDMKIINTVLVARHVDNNNFYHSEFHTPPATGDPSIARCLDGAYSNLARESVDLTDGDFFVNSFSITGSTLKMWRQEQRDLTAAATISATDTTFASGAWGHSGIRVANVELLAPVSRLQPAKVILEAEITGSGERDNPFRPDLAQLLDKHPEFGDIDKYAVTWGAFDHKPEHATMLIMITSDNPYQSGAIDKQIEHAKSKNLKVLKPPRDYAEAVEQYKTLRKDFPEWLAGKDDFAYRTIGHEEIEPLAVADFYYGELIDHKTYYDQLKKVPDWEMERTLKRWKERLERVTAVPTERKELHLKKLKEVLRVGW